MKGEHTQRFLPGEHKATSCTTKKKYASAREAGRAKDAVKKRLHLSARLEALNVYRCEYCIGYHIGRPQRRRKRHAT